MVGDQSSGKSSVLEGLTGLSFPVASDLCTRYATQIVLRRAPASDAGARISIIPGPSSQADSKVLERLQSFERRLAADDFDLECFRRVLDEVSEAQELRFAIPAIADYIGCRSHGCAGSDRHRSGES